MITFKELLSKLLETQTKPPGPTGKSKMTKASNKLKKVNTKVNFGTSIKFKKTES